MYFIKIKCTDMRRFEFLTPRGGLTSKRFHASMFETFDHAWRVAEEIVDGDNPHDPIIKSVCVVTFDGKKRTYVNH